MTNGKNTPGKSDKPIVLVVNLADQSSEEINMFRSKTLGDIAINAELKEILPPRTSKCPDSEENKKILVYIVDSVRAHVKKHGTVAELRFGGHGESKSLSFDETSFDTDQLLSAIRDLQKELGVKVAERISFIGCNTFTNLKSSDVDHYRKASKELGSEIIGIPDYGIHSKSADRWKTLPAVSFKNGEVKKLDHLYADSDFSLLRGLIKTAMLGFLGVRYNDNWVQCHEGKSQEQGAACQKTREPLDAKESEMNAAISAPQRFILGHIYRKYASKDECKNR